jgi:hypothetical protein
MLPIDTKRAGEAPELLCMAAEVQRDVVRKARMNEAIEALWDLTAIHFDQQAVSSNGTARRDGPAFERRPAISSIATPQTRNRNISRKLQLTIDNEGAGAVKMSA